MAQSQLFYRERAEADQQAAAEATLDNVRERCLRSMQHWLEMAERTQACTERREEREAASQARVSGTRIEPELTIPV